MNRHGYPKLVRGTLGVLIPVRTWEEHRDVLKRQERVALVLLACWAATVLWTLLLLAWLAWELFA